MKIDNKSETTIIESLNMIASDLVLNKAIHINDRYFSIIDLEVYYWSTKHPDDYAKGVKHERPFGELEAHRYGIDFSLGNCEDEGFGGVLICGLFDFSNNTVIEKPLVQRTLFNSFKSGNNSIQIKEHENSWNEVFKSKRNNLGIDDTTNKKKYINSLYKVLAKNESLYKSYKGKERIFKYSNLVDEEVKDFLGYRKKR